MCRELKMIKQRPNNTLSPDSLRRRLKNLEREKSKRFIEDGNYDRANELNAVITSVKYWLDKRGEEEYPGV